MVLLLCSVVERFVGYRYPSVPGNATWTLSLCSPYDPVLHKVFNKKNLYNASIQYLAQ